MSTFQRASIGSDCSRTRRSNSGRVPSFSVYDRNSTTRLTRTPSRVDEHLEAAVHHPAEVERHVLRVHMKARILHDTLVHAIPMGLGLVHDVGEKHRLARTRARSARERDTHL